MFGTGAFGTSAVTTQSLFGATNTPSTSGFGGFGALKPATTTATGFGGFGSGFGTTSTANTLGTTSLFGSTNQQQPTGLFGATNQQTATGLFGTTNQLQQTAQQQQAAQQQNVNADTIIAVAIAAPQIFNDERDNIIAKWNLLQASWGTGKGCYSQTGMVDFTPENRFCRFKAIGYNCLLQSKNEDGLVSITIDQPFSDVRNVQQQYLDALHKIIGGQQTMSICVQGLKPLPSNKTELVLYILQRPPSGPARKLLSTDLVNAFSQQNIKTQLVSQLKVSEVLPKIGINTEDLKLYLDSPPAGVDPLLWQQAKLDNPAPDKFIPVPIIGFTKMNLRLKQQEEQTKLHQNQLDVLAQQISKCRIAQTNVLCKLNEYKHKQLELSHRVLKVVVKQEVARKLGYTIQVEEELLRSQLEAIQTELNHPTQFKGRLNELVSQLRMQYQGGPSRADTSYQMDTTLQTEIKQLLKSQQEGLQHLISVLREDASHMKIIEDGLASSIHH